MVRPTRATASAVALTAKVLLLFLTAVAVLSAGTVTYTPAPTTQAGWSACGAYPGYSCMTTAYFDASSLDAQVDGGVVDLFQQAFNTWNASGGGQGWTLVKAPDVGTTFTVDTATAQQFAGVTLGGLTIHVAVGGTLPTAGANEQLVWSQGLYINYTVGPQAPAVPGYYAMDTSTLSNLDCSQANIFCPPAYPYQYNDDSFYDQPKAFYNPPRTTQDFFNGDAYLSVENTATKTLTIYDGVSYGFQNYVSPEPGAWLLFGSGIVALLLIRRRNSAKVAV
ncbi:MAG: PEP-CTERM sorting domain-containing protein [Bryobacteraceae bacterium]